MSDEVSDPNVRKGGGGLWLTHRQIGWGTGSLVTSLALISQLKSNFVTIEKANAQDQQMALLRLDIATVKNDLTDSIHRGNDKVIDRIKESEDRMSHTTDAQARRIEGLEASLRIGISKKSTN